MRPNYSLAGHNMPIFYCRKFGREFSHAARTGMIATDFDSLTGQYATQGPSHYVVARMHSEPYRTTESLLDEYYSAFGPAETAVRDYFEHWEQVSNAVSDEFFEKACAATGGGSWVLFHKVAPRIFTPEVMAEGFRLLETAGAAAAADAVAMHRVDFLGKGLRNAKLTFAAEEAFRQYEKTREMEPYRSAIVELDRFRRSVETENVSNMSFLNWFESRTGRKGQMDRQVVYGTVSSTAEMLDGSPP